MATQDLFDVRGQVALVTGASSGIGEAIARGLAEVGAMVGCFARASERLDAVVADIERAGGRAVACPGDVRDQDTLEGAVQSVEAWAGPLSLAVNSAGIADAHPAEDMPRASSGSRCSTSI